MSSATRPPRSSARIRERMVEKGPSGAAGDDKCRTMSKRRKPARALGAEERELVTVPSTKRKKKRTIIVSDDEDDECEQLVLVGQEEEDDGSEGQRRDGVGRLPRAVLEQTFMNWLAPTEEAQLKLVCKYFRRCVTIPPGVCALLSWAVEAQSLDTFDRHSPSPADLEAAVGLCRRRREDPSGDLLCLMGRLFDVGEGVDKDQALARRLYHSSALKGNRGGQFWIGVAQAARSRQEQTPQESLRYWKLAAKQGHVEAMHRLGVSKGGVSRRKGRAWLRKAAERGHKGAAFLLVMSGIDNLNKGNNGDARRESQEERAVWYNEAQNWLDRVEFSPEDEGNLRAMLEMMSDMHT